MPRHTRIPAALGIALLATLAPPALAASPPRVPAGEVQHTVTLLRYPKATNSAHHDTVRNESWMSATAGRELETNITSNRAHSDCQFKLGDVSRCWTNSFKPGNPGLIHINPGDPSFLESWASRGKIEEQQIKNPKTGLHITGKTTYLGRPALKVTADPVPTARGGTSNFSMIVDAKTYYPLRQESVITGDPYTTKSGQKGIQKFDEVIETRVMETLKVGSVRLTMRPHPGAKVVYDVARAKKSAAR